ncbi:MAG: hypothetical protein R3Y53_06120 [Bacillota bacterium]
MWQDVSGNLPNGLPKGVGKIWKFSKGIFSKSKVRGDSGQKSPLEVRSKESRNKQGAVNCPSAFTWSGDARPKGEKIKRFHNRRKKTWVL